MEDTNPSKCNSNVQQCDPRKEGAARGLAPEIGRPRQRLEVRVPPGLHVGHVLLSSAKPQSLLGRVSIVFQLDNDAGDGGSVANTLLSTTISALSSLFCTTML